MTETALNLNIAKCIVNAQICSDSGKGYYYDSLVYSSLAKAMRRKRYKGKDTQILKAIKLVNCQKKSGFFYYVKADTSGTAAYIVYFNFKLNGKRKQISFHSFDRRLEKFTNNACPTYWDKKSSRETAIELAENLLK